MDNTKPEIEVQTVQYDQFVIKSNNNIADIDDVMNVLTVMTNSDRKLNYFEKPEATNYLKSVGLISEPEPNNFKIEDLQGCKDLNNHLSTFMENLIEKYSKPDIMINSSHKSNDK